jgi:hypothetical protein
MIMEFCSHNGQQGRKQRSNSRNNDSSLGQLLPRPSRKAASHCCGGGLGLHDACKTSAEHNSTAKVKDFTRQYMA